MKKSFPHDLMRQDNTQHATIRLESKMDNKGKYDVIFSCTEIDCVVHRSNLGKSPRIDRINDKMIEKFQKCRPSIFLTLFNSC